MYYCPLYRMPFRCPEHTDESDHTHFIEGTVTYVNGHDHEYETYTSEQIKVGNSHIHFFRGETTSEHGHNHRYCGYTEEAVYTHDGNHYHKYGSRTSYEVKHFHEYEGMSTLKMPMMEV